MVGEGFEPSKALPSDLQSDPFDHSGNPPLLSLPPPAGDRTVRDSLAASDDPRVGDPAAKHRRQGFP